MPPAQIALIDGDLPALSDIRTTEQWLEQGKAISADLHALVEEGRFQMVTPAMIEQFIAQVHAPLRMTDEIVDMFLTLPEFDQNPLPLHERVNPYFTVQSLKLYRPLGVVAAISAYNVPFYTAFWKVIPALMAGNSVVLRPNPFTPLSAMIFAEAADEAVADAGLDIANDPDNRFLWRANPRRMEAEVVRDSTLQVAGGLPVKIEMRSGARSRTFRRESIDTAPALTISSRAAGSPFAKASMASSSVRCEGAA